MIKGMAACKLTTAKTGDDHVIDLVISSPQVMLLGTPRHWKQSTPLARLIQALVTVYRPKTRSDILGMPDTWEVLRGLDSTETTFTAGQLNERLTELGMDLSVRQIAGLLGSVIRTGGHLFCVVGYPRTIHIDTAVKGFRASKQSMEAGLIYFNLKKAGDTYTMTILPRFRGAWSQNRSIDELIVEEYHDALPDAMRDIIDNTCIPNGPDWVRNHYEGYRRWE